MATLPTVNLSSIAGVAAAIGLYKNNPAAIQRISLGHLRQVSGIDIVDPTNPYVNAIESASVNVSAFLVENEANTRKQYPAVAQTAEDLYIHMSGKDYKDRFSSPAKTTFKMLILKSDLLQKLVYDPATGNKKATIPRNSEFIVADTTFSLQYPIDIKQLQHGGLQIVYDTTQESPLQDLTTNIIPFEIRTDPEQKEWIYFEFSVSQFKINTITSPLTVATGFIRKLDITDEYYFARVFFKTNTGVWNEIKTTHTDQVYDPFVPTAVLKLVGKQLTVTIPQIYFNSELIKGTLRVDVYETKGYIHLSMENYRTSAFNAKWFNINKSDDTVFTAVIPTLTVLPFSDLTVDGGTPPLTFEQLRSRVIDNTTGSVKTPITNVQIASTLSKKGYSVVKDVDVVTNRVFLATRSLPKPIDNRLITAGASSIETFTTSLAQAINFAGVKNNGNRVTLTPELMYRNVSGVVKIFPKANLNALLAQSAEDIAINVTNSKYLYTPFHYVLDTSTNNFEVRPYYLDTPKAKSVRFITQNELTGLQINTQNFIVTRTTTGYKLIVSTRSNDAAKTLSDALVNAQLSFVPPGEDARAYLNGTMVGRTEENERTFEFDLSSNFDVTANDHLILTKFQMFSQEDRLVASLLSNEFDIIYSSSSPMPNSWQVSSIEPLLGRFLIPDMSAAVTQEKIKIMFGYSLKNLWCRSRSVVQQTEYQRYSANVPRFYETPTYEKNPVNGSIFNIVAGQVVYNTLHAAGTPVLDAQNNPTFKHFLGDPVLDAQGQPIPLAASTVERQIDMMFIEGSYVFATDSASAEYRKTIVDTVVAWVTEDLESIDEILLEQTRIFFYPKTTMGNIKVVTDGDTTSSIDAGQYFKLDLYVNNTVYANSALRESLRKSAISVIDDALQNPVIAISDITSSLRSKLGSDVISLHLTGLGGTANLSTVSLKEDGDRLNIRKRLVRQADNKLIVEEDVTVTFIKHEL